VSPETRRGRPGQEAPSIKLANLSLVSLPDPLRAAYNAIEAGHNAEVFLAELRPLWRLIGGTVAS
jgi:hypothetical protein